MTLPSSLRLKENKSQQFPSSLKLKNQNKTPTTLKKKEEEEEGFLKSRARDVLQVPMGLANATPYGIATNLVNLLGTGAALDPEEIEQIRKISERSGIPFDEEKYLESVQQASGMFPTPGNIGRMVEEKTGIPLEAKTLPQKLIQTGASAYKFTPGSISQKATAAIATPAAKAGLEELGVPEPLSDLVAYPLGSISASKAPKVTFESKIKPSGMKERGFESLTEPIKVSERKLGQINKSIEEDFKGITQKIIDESPVGETARNIKNDPTYKQKTKELLNEAQDVANNTKGHLSKKNIIDEYANVSKKSKKGFADSEYEDQYSFYMNKASKKVTKNVTYGELVEQFRKNNQELSESFDPSISKATNRAKRDALLDQNRAISNLIEKKSPNSELSTVFKEGNSRWSKIMDAEAMDLFIEDLFSNEINFKKAGKALDNPKYGRIFEKSLGKEGVKKFETLLEDLSSTESAYKMLKVAKSQGYNDLFGAASLYFFSPDLAKLKTVASLGKYAKREMLNTLLDKPKVRIKVEKGVDFLKRGKFKEAEKEFQSID